MPDEPITISDFEFVRRIGRGSYGEVWLARSITGIYRAIKVVYRNSFAEARPFEREFAGIKRFEPISRSQPNLVDILHVGRKDDQNCFYYVMELADTSDANGTSLPEVGSPAWIGNYRPKTLREVLARRQRLPIDQALPVAVGLSRAVGHLHSHGLIHRDIKPSNVIFVNDNPKLADIGLISAVEESHSIVGTEGFVPPEGPGTPAADLFSLGKLLYEMATGRDRLEFPKLPVDLEKLPDRAAFLEFNEIVLKACQPAVGDRYTSASDLLDDLLLLQAGRSVRRLRTAERRLARVVPIGLTALAILAAVLVIQHLRTRKAQELAQVEARYRNQAESQELATRHLLYAADMNLAHQAFEAGDLGRVRSLLTGQIPKSRQADLRGFEWRYYWSRAQGDQTYTFPAQKRPVAALAFSPDGKELASAGYDNRADLWDFSTRQLLKTFKTGGPVEDVAFSSDGQEVLTSDETGCVEAKNISTGQTTFHLEGKFCRMAVSPRGFQLALGSGGKQFSLNQGPGAIWDYRSKQKLFSLPEAGTYVAFSPDGRRLATGSWDHELKVWDAQTGSVLQRLSPVDSNFGMSFSPDGKKLATGDESGYVRVWDLENGKQLAGVQAHIANIFKTAISPDGKCLATVSADQTVRLWDAESLSPLLVLRGHLSEVWGVAFSRDSSNLVSSGKDGTIRVWDLGQHARSDVLTRDVAFWQWPVFSGDGRWLATGERKAGVTLWSVTNGALAGSLPKATRPLGFSTKSAELFVLSGTGDIERWSIPLTNREPVSRARLNSGRVTAQVLLPDQNLLITGNEQGDLSLWDMNSGKGLAAWKTNPTRIVSIAVSPDEHTLATVNENDKDAKLWDLTTHQLKASLQGHSLSIYCVAFSPDGRLVATASVDDRCGLWDARTGQLVTMLEGHKGGTYSVAFSADDKTVAVGCNDGELKLWNLETRRDMMTLKAESHAIFSTAFSPDGHTLATVSFNHHSQECSLKLWRAADFPISEFSLP